MGGIPQKRTEKYVIKIINFVAIKVLMKMRIQNLNCLPSRCWWKRRRRCLLRRRWKKSNQGGFDHRERFSSTIVSMYYLIDLYSLLMYVFGKMFLEILHNI